MMDQYFYLVNVDRKEARFLGRLREPFYGKLGLFQYLARVPSSDGEGIWAGHRLITIGNYMKKKCPAGMLTKAEEDEMNEWLRQQRKGSYYSFVAENYHRDTYNAEKRITAPDDKILILRNLSKRVYVREQDFLRYQWQAEAKDIHRHIRGFDPLILINTAWSPDPSCNVADPGFDVIPGPWAGDRFDITVLEDIQDPESWQDVTKQEAEKMAKIMEAERQYKMCLYR